MGHITPVNPRWQNPAIIPEPVARGKRQTDVADHLIGRTSVQRAAIFQWWMPVIMAVEKKWKTRGLAVSLRCSACSRAAAIFCMFSTDPDHKRHNMADSTWRPLTETGTRIYWVINENSCRGRRLMAGTDSGRVNTMLSYTWTCTSWRGGGG